MPRNQAECGCVDPGRERVEILANLRLHPRASQQIRRGGRVTTDRRENQDASVSIERFQQLDALLLAY